MLRLEVLEDRNLPSDVVAVAYYPHYGETIGYDTNAPTPFVIVLPAPPVTPPDIQLLLPVPPPPVAGPPIPPELQIV
jgi:hypothetical protein